MAHILIADDDPVQGTVLAKLLTQSPGLDLTDVEIMKTVDAQTGIGELSETKANVVIVALAGQGTRALSLCQTIRKSRASDATRIAVVGAKIPAPEVLRQIEQVFSARFFAKPFELSQLSSYVASSLGRPTNQVVQKRKTTSFGTGESGELAVRRLAAVLLDLVEEGDSGLLHICRGKISKRISISKGIPVGVRSSARDEALGQFLLSQGLINRRAHHDAIRSVATSKKRIGEVLVELGAITEPQLAIALSAQVRFKLIRSLRWPDGQWRFEPRMDVGDGAGDRIDVVGLVVSGLKESARYNVRADYLQDLIDCPLQLNARGVRMQKVWEKLFNPGLAGQLIAATDTPILATDLMADGFPRTAVLELIDTLWHCDAVTVLRHDRPSDSSARVDIVTVADIAARSQRIRRASPSGKPLMELLFGDNAEEFATGPKTGSESLLEQSTKVKPVNIASLAPPRLRPLPNAAQAGAQEFEDNATVANAPAPKELLGLYLRFQGNDFYKIVGADARSEQEQIEAAVARTEAELARAGILGSDDETMDVPLARSVKRSFEQARDVLLSASKRANYDRELRENRVSVEADPIKAELAFGRAQEAIKAGSWQQAVRELHVAVEAAPNEATYRAELGWSHYLKGGKSTRAADQARPHLNIALAIDYDHAAAHEYKGLISAALGNDEIEAIFHLNKALDHDPKREKALEALELLYERRGELRRLERLYRQLLQRQVGGEEEAGLWLRAGRLYKTRLDDPRLAEIAFATATELAPNNPDIVRLANELSSGGPAQFAQRGVELVARWLANPYDGERGRKLHVLALECRAFDHAFIAASNLVATGGADERAEETYRRYRPRFVVRSQRPIEGPLWDELCDDADSTDVAELLALLAPAIHQLAPISLDDLEVGQRHLIGDDSLPETLISVRDYVAHILRVPVPRIYGRVDFGGQIHVGGLNPPVLLVGTEILATPERLELAFRLGRAMSYLRPGRALGGSHSGTLLRRVVLAAFYVSHPETAPKNQDADLAAAIASVEGLAIPARRHLRDLVDGAAERSPNLNLTDWKDSLVRTANRIGLLLCGDVPAAMRFAADNGGSQAVSELLRFTIGGSFAKMRTALGLSIDV